MHSTEIERHEKKHNSMTETEMKNEAKQIWETQMKVACGNGKRDERKNAYGDGRELDTPLRVWFSKMSVEVRQLRALNSLKTRPNDGIFMCSS